MWLDDNSYMLESNQMISLKNSKKCCPKRERISKRKFQEMTQFRNLSPPNSDEENEQDQSSFTISVRRLKIYDNALNCIHGKKCKRYDQKYIEAQLEHHLNRLEGKCELESEKSGPFGYFKVSKPERKNSGPYETPRSSICEQASVSTQENLHVSLPDTPESLLKLTGDDFMELLRGNKIVSRFMAKHWNHLIWTNSGNFCLRQPHYVTWLTSYMNDYLNNLRPEDESLRMICSIVEGTLDLDKCLSALSWMENNDGKTVYLLLLLLLTQEKTKLYNVIVGWIEKLKPEGNLYLAYPLISYALNTLPAVALSQVCYSLLNTMKSSIDLFQEELTLALKIQMTRLLVQHWNDTMIENVCQGQDNSHAVGQVKFWELQLQCNLELYRDIYFDGLLCNEVIL